MPVKGYSVDDAWGARAKTSTGEGQSYVMGDCHEQATFGWLCLGAVEWWPLSEVAEQGRLAQTHGPQKLAERSRKLERETLASGIASVW